MRGYLQAGYAFDLEENEDRIRCVAAPIRDVAGRTIAAISVSSAAQYMGDHRMQALSKDVMAAAHRISEGLGWTGRHPVQPTSSDAPSAGARDSSRRSSPSRGPARRRAKA
jgi:transcriptional regulator of acetoin/glycerol metabolism